MDILSCGNSFGVNSAIISKKLADITNSKEITLYTDELASLKTEVDRDHLRKLHEEEAARQAKGAEEAQRKEKKLEAGKKGG